LDDAQTTAAVAEQESPGERSMSYLLLLTLGLLFLSASFDLAINGAYRTGRAGVLRVPNSRDPDHRRDCRSGSDDRMKYVASDAAA
ncbi:MAG: hypothetical protein M3380_04495, partial [Chloroflexota bacterium]|nr:hypothetical protein [Chloroflexota bacterium]